MSYSNNHNPYNHNNGANPYGNNNDPYGNNQLNQQRRLQKEQEQRQYKQNCETSFDNIVADFTTAKRNNVELVVNEANKSAIMRYFKRYWDNKFLSLSLLILLITAILSFYTMYAAFGILAVFLVKMSYSQANFTRYFLNDSDVNKHEIKEIESLIFGNKLDIKMMFIVSILLSIISFITYIFSTNIWIFPEHHTKLIVFLSKLSEFNVSNELFAYVNVISISILMLLKTIEKWKK